MFLGRKAVIHLDSRDISLLTKVHLVKAMVFPVVMYRYESWTIKKVECQRILNCGVGKDPRESLGLHGDQTSQSSWKSTLDIHWKDWCKSWSSNTLAMWCEEAAHWKRPWCWSRLKAGREGDHRRWDGWIASLEFEQILGDSEGQGSLVCCSPGGHRESDRT